MSHTERASSLLQQAITYLVNYTAAEAKAHMDAYNLASRVAAIAYDKLTDKLGMWNMLLQHNGCSQSKKANVRLL